MHGFLARHALSYADPDTVIYVRGTLHLAIDCITVSCEQNTVVNAADAYAEDGAGGRSQSERSGGRFRRRT